MIEKAKKRFFVQHVRLPDERQRLRAARRPAALAWLRARRGPGLGRLRLPEHLRRAREGRGEARPLARAPASAQAAPAGLAHRCGRVRGPVGRSCDPRSRGARGSARGDAQPAPRPRVPRARRGRRRACGRPRSQGRPVRDPGLDRRPREPRARIRHRHGGLQPRVQLLRRSADARAGGAAARRGHRLRDGGARRAWLLRGDAPGPDGERLPRWGSRLRRPARSCPRGRGTAAPALHDLAPRARRPVDGPRLPRSASACAPTSTCRSSRVPTGSSPPCAGATPARSTSRSWTACATASRTWRSPRT